MPEELRVVFHDYVWDLESIEELVAALKSKILEALDVHLHYSKQLVRFEIIDKGV